MPRPNSLPPSEAMRPLPVTITRGMPVVSLADNPTGQILGVTQAYCVLRLGASDRISVAPWRELALGNVCPASALLPTDVSENDRLNASAMVLRELLQLRHLSPLSPAQNVVCQELLTELCDRQRL